jgi:hypothetical protein
MDAKSEIVAGDAMITNAGQRGEFSQKGGLLFITSRA